MSIFNKLFGKKRGGSSKMKNLTGIMDMEITQTHKFTSMDEIHRFARDARVVLPGVYVQFLLEYGGRYIRDNYCYKALEKTPRTPEDGYDSADYFYGNDIADNIELFESELERKLFPIADAGGGDFVCIGVAGEYAGRIYYWVHDASEKLSDSIYLIADTFDNFAASFEEHKQSTQIDLDDIELELDEDLL